MFSWIALSCFLELFSCLRCLVGLVKPLFHMLQRVFQVYCRASNLKVDQTVPDLLGLPICKHSHTLLARLVMRNVLEDIIVPKDRVLHKMLVSQGSNCATVLVCGELEHVALDFHVHIVVKEAFTAQFPLDEHLECADQVAIGHARHVHGQQTDHSLEEISRDDVRDRLPLPLKESLSRDDIFRVPKLNILQIIEKL